MLHFTGFFFTAPVQAKVQRLGEDQDYRVDLHGGRWAAAGQGGGAKGGGEEDKT